MNLCEQYGNIMLHKPVTVLMLLLIFFIYLKKYVNCSICAFTLHKPLMCKPCVGAKLVLRFQALITDAFLDRSMLFLYRESACTSGSIFRKRISFISRFGAIVSYFVRGNSVILCQRGHFLDSPCIVYSLSQQGTS